MLPDDSVATSEVALALASNASTRSTLDSGREEGHTLAALGPT